MNIALEVSKYVESLERIYPVKIKRESVWTNEYAIFVVDFGLFVDATPRRDRACKEILDELLIKFQDCEVRSWPLICEFEIQGPNYREFYNQHEDMIETLGYWYEHAMITCGEKTAYFEDLNEIPR